MTSNDGNDLTPDQEKLEWVTPKISLMDAGDTDGSGKQKDLWEFTWNLAPFKVGPS